MKVANEYVLTPEDHDRDGAGLTYVYPVVSRRAGGLSVGINLNPNNACNWRCVYCQVPNLVRGAAPVIDVEKLGRELSGFLASVRDGDFMRRRVPEGLRVLRDIAFSGNGEPTSARRFAEIVRRVGEIRGAAGYGADVPLRLITNGSLMGRAEVIRGVEALAAASGEVWFKVDAADPADVARINDVRRSRARTLRDLRRCCQACPTWVQTCVFAWDGEVPTTRWREDYLELLAEAREAGLRGVLLYGVARQSMQPERIRLSPLPATELEAIAAQIRAQGLTVVVSP